MEGYDAKCPGSVESDGGVVGGEERRKMSARLPCDDCTYGCRGRSFAGRESTGIIVAS